MNTALSFALSNFKQKDGELVIGGKKISEIVSDIETPVYLYDQSILKKRYETLKAVMPAELKIDYAIKANPNQDIIKILASYYDGFDIASIGELKKAVNAGINPYSMNFAGPGKKLSELREAIRAKIGSISVESESEAAYIEKVCKDLNMPARIMVRVNPEFELAQSGMKMGGGPKQFGVDAERVPALIKTITSNKQLIFKGIHIFAGSQNLNAEALLSNFRKICQYAYSLSQECRTRLEIVNMGGGFGIPYFAKDQDLNLPFIGNGLKDLIREFTAKMPETEFKIELGRFIVGECGLYISRVLYRKKSHGHVFIITDGGMHHHLAASGNFGQSLVRRPMPITTANRLNAQMERVTITGPLCTPLDTFGSMDLPKADEGDLIAVFNSGAYGLSASPVGFLSHELPIELII